MQKNISLVENKPTPTPAPLENNELTSSDKPIANIESELVKVSAHTKNMVFTSAGDNTNFHILWASNDKPMNYDIYCIYYGSNQDKYDLYSKTCKFVEIRKG